MSGEGKKLQEIIKQADSEAQKKLDEVTEKLKKLQEAFSGRVEKILDDATTMGVLSAFLDSGKSGSAALVGEVKTFQGTHIEDWTFYSACKKKLKQLGIEGELADVQLQKFFWK